MKEPFNKIVFDEDAELMLKFKKDQDKAAFDRLLDKYHAPMINFIYRIIPDKAEAEDLAQEVFLRVYKSAKDYRPEAKFSTYLYKIAKNLALNELRRRRLRFTVSLNKMIFGDEHDELPMDIPDDKPSPADELEKQDIASAVRRAIDSLPPNQRMAVVLSRYDELSYEEIAGVIGCSVKAVKSLLNRAKVSLRDKLRNFLPV